MGGTQFVGRHFVDAALAKGHELTLFHRGKTGADLFPTCEHILGDRLENLDGLAGKSWDALVDVSAYVPRAVRMLADTVGDRIPYCLQVSTISVYGGDKDFIDEDSEFATLEDPTTEVIDWQTYGGLKALCEVEGEKRFPKISFVRPTYVVGPHDHTERFTYWVDRFGKNQKVVYPVRADGVPNPMQYIDGRDLGEFMLTLVENQTTGTYNAVAPSQPFSEGLNRIKSALGSSSEIVTTLAEVEATDFPLCPPNDGTGDSRMTISNAKSVAAGLKNRPFEETVRDLWDWWKAEGRTPKVGASDEQLAKYL